MILDWHNKVNCPRNLGGVQTALVMDIKSRVIA